MALVTTKEMFQKAFEGKYAIGAFNINNMEIIQGIIDGAKAQNSAVILQCSSGAIKYMSPEYLRGVVVEAELGKLAGVEDEVKVAAHEATYTDPDQAVDFVKRTGVDSLAIAIGTSHGAYKFKGEAKLDFDRLETITRKLEEAGIYNYPIVLHGASAVDPVYVEMCNNNGGEIKGAKGVPTEMLRKAASMSVCKINMDTDLRLAVTGTVRKVFAEKPSEFDPRKYLGEARKNLQSLVEDKIKNVLGSVDSMK